MEHGKFSTVAKSLVRIFGAGSLDAVGRETGFCQRQRMVTASRLVLGLLDVMASGTARCIADLHGGFNALAGTTVQYKPFHNQLAKPAFATLMRTVLGRAVEELAVEALRFSPESPFAQFGHICIQDGTSFAVKPALADRYPGRFTAISPAAVELHVDLNLLEERVNRVVMTPDCATERTFLPQAEEVTGGLLLADRGYFDTRYLRTLSQTGGHFIVRAGTGINPTVLRATGPDGRAIKGAANQPLKTLVTKLGKLDHADLWVRFASKGQGFECRIVAHPNPKEGRLRYLVTNLDPELFTPAHISDAYRLRWQIELLFKEWKSFASLHRFDTANPHIVEGLIWAALCAATLKRYCAHRTQHLFEVAVSTQRVAKCIHHVLGNILAALLYEPDRLPHHVEHALRYLAGNAKRAHPDRDRKTGRLKLGLEHVYLGA